MTLSPYPSRAVALTLLSRHLVGEGLELGPGHHPLPLPLPGASVRYVDRWEPEDNRRLFPELAEDATFTRPDVVANLATDRLSMFPAAGVDFVVASHLLEHLADPLGLLVDIHRVLRPGGTLLILLPDRRRTFDASRPPTPLAHLLADHAAGVSEPDDAHVAEFLAAIGQLELATDDAARARLFAEHRRRSIHVHCWTEEEFAEALVHTIGEMGLRWDFVDAVLASEVADSLEFGFVLRRSPLPVPASVGAARFEACWAAHRGRVADLLAAGEYLDARRRDAEGARAAAEAARATAEAAHARAEADARAAAGYVAEIERDRDALRAVIAHQQARLALLRRPPLGPLLRTAVRARRRLRPRRPGGAAPTG